MINAQHRFFSLIILILGLSFRLLSQTNYASEDELKKNASSLFQEGKFKEAMPLFSQLVSLYPADPNYNYKYGACLISGDADKSKSLKYLKFATSKPNVDNLANYYYAKSLHLNYEFKKAIGYYTKFNGKANTKEKAALQTERAIKMCQNGSTLLKDLNDVDVLGKQEIKRSDFFRVYDLNEIGGKIIVKPDEFKTKFDLKNQEYSILHLPENAKELYYSSYGDNKANGKDIFRISKLTSGEWGEPENIGAPVNTKFDEDFPFMHSDGRTLYFSSKGHNSMGGYDVFQTTYNESTGTWSNPKNMDFAISSADDDILFISNKENDIAYFASSRYSLSDYITVYKVLINRRPVELSVVKGQFIAEADASLKKAKITIIDVSSDETLGIFNSDPASGEYAIKIPKNGGSFKFVVETTSDAPIHSGKVVIPYMSKVKPLKQELRLVGLGSEQKLVIKNLFDQGSDEELDPELLADIVRNKAKLDVNTTEEEAKSNRSNERSVTEIGSSGSETEEEYENLTNQQLLTTVQKDSKRIKEEVQQLKNQANYIYNITNQKAKKADELFAENEDLMDQLANADESKKEEILAQIDANKKVANPLAAEVIAGYSLSGSLENEAAEKELGLKSINTLQSQLGNKVNANDRSGAIELYKNSSDKINELDQTASTYDIEPSRMKEQYTLKKEKANQAASYARDLEEEKSDLEKEILRNKEEVKTLKGKKKEELQNQINAFELDLEDIGFEADNVAKKASKLRNEAALYKKEMELTNSLVEEVQQTDKTAGALSDEDKLRLDKMVDYFKEQNLLDGILGDEEIIALEEDVKSATENEHQPVVDSEGNSIDYAARYNAEIDAANNISEPSEKEETLKNIYENWSKSLNEDLEIKRNKLSSSNDDDEKNQLSQEIQKIEQSLLDVSDKLSTTDEVALANTPESNSSNSTVEIDDNALEEQIPLSPVDAKGEELNYNEIYANKLTELQGIEEEDQKETKIQQLNQLWKKTIVADIELKKTALENEKKKSKKDELIASISKLRALEAEKEGQLNVAQTDSGSNSQQNETGQDTEPSNANENQSDEIQLGVVPSKKEIKQLDKQPASIFNEEGQVINYHNYYKEELEKALVENNEKRQIEVNQNWSISTQAEIAHQKNELTSTQEDEKDAIYAKIAALEAIDELHKEAVSKTTQEDKEVQLTNMVRLADEPEAVMNKDEVIDYNSFYENQYKLAKEQGDEVKVNEVNKQWLVSTQAEIDHRKEQFLGAAEPQDVDDLYALVASLEAVQRKRRKAMTEEGGKAVGKAEYEAFMKLSKDPAAIGDEEGVLDYNTFYETQIALAQEQGDANKQATINQNWFTSISEEITLRKKQIAETDDQQEKDKLQAIVTNLERQQQEKMRAVGSTAQVLSAVAGTASSPETSNNEDPTEQEIRDRAVEVDITDGKGNIVDYGAEYQEQMNGAEAIEDPYEKAVLLNEINSKWATSIGKEVDQKNEILEATTKKKKKEKLTDEIQTLNAQKSEKQKQSDEQLVVLNTLKKEKQEQKMTAQYQNEKLGIQYRIQDYHYAGSGVNLNKAGLLINAVVQAEEQIEQKNKELEKETDNAKRNEIIAEINTLQERSANLQLQVAEIFAEGHRDEYNEKREMLQNKATDEKNLLSALNEQKVNELNAAADLKFTEASRLRSTAKSGNNFNEQRSLLQKAYDLELEAFQLQQEAIVIYEEKADTKEVASQETNVDEPIKRQPSDEKLVMAQKEIDEIEASEEFAKYAEIQEESIRLIKEAQVNYETVKSYKAESDALKTQAADKRAEAEKIKKKKERKRALAEAQELENKAIQQEAKADSVQAIAQQLENDSKAKENEGSSYLKSLDDDALFQKLLAYYTAKLNGLLEVEKEKELAANTDVKTFESEVEVSVFQSIDFEEVPEVIEKDVFVKSKERNVSAYSTTKPIPINKKVPEGIIFKVQIGAFRNPIPQNLFKGFAPVNGETTSSGITRYTAGLFTIYQNANQAKNEIRNLGYSDAFVVAFRNGERIPISEALNILGVDPEAAQAATSFPGTNQITTPAARNQNDANGEIINEAITREAPDVRQVTGLFYTVQVGVYSNTTIPAQLSNLRPLNSERTENGYIRYTTGRYNSFEEALQRRRQVAAGGVSDAFVTAYLNGKRISIPEARNYEQE